MQVAILTGIYARTDADLVRSYPINVLPITETATGEGTGISKGYLKLAPGIATKTAIGAQDRGGVVWGGSQYRVIGSALFRVSTAGGMTAIGDVGDGGPVVFAMSFDRLAINSGSSLYYYDGTTLTLVTDPDLGPVNSLAWSDGYFLTTDGTSIVATELNDPTSVDPLKYGSSEADPDPVKGLLAIRGEIYALNRHTIEVFINAGTTGFPFLRQRGAQIPKGCTGPLAFVPFVETFAFCGSAKNEQVAIYLAGSGQGIKISPKTLDDALAALPDEQLANVHLESINRDGLTILFVHLPTVTWIYHWTASQQLDLPVWSQLAGGVTLEDAYPARGFTYHAGEWWCGGAAAIGVMSDTAVTWFGQPFGYRFDTPLFYNGGMGAIVHDLELVTLAGAAAAGDPKIFMSSTEDGVTYSQERACSIGRRGDRSARPAWRRLGRLRNWRGFRFRGIAEAPVSYARLEALVEPLGGEG